MGLTALEGLQRISMEMSIKPTTLDLLVTLSRLNKSLHVHHKTR